MKIRNKANLGIGLCIWSLGIGLLAQPSATLDWIIGFPFLIIGILVSLKEITE